MPAWGPRSAATTQPLHTTDASHSSEALMVSSTLTIHGLWISEPGATWRYDRHAGTRQ